MTIFSYIDTLHTDKSVEGSLANLQHKVEVENSAYEKSLLNISEPSKIITTYELITILLVDAGLGGISEIAKAEDISQVYDRVANGQVRFRAVIKN
jgi:hypothetical protein